MSIVDVLEMKFFLFQTFQREIPNLMKEERMWELQVISFPNYDKKGSESRKKTSRKKKLCENT